MQGMRIMRIFIATQSKRNFIFIGVIFALAIANLFVILDLNGFTVGTAQIASVFAPNIVMVAIAVIGGRVTPNFTRNYLQQQGVQVNIRSFPLVEKLAIGLLVLNALVDLVMPHSSISYIVALLACTIHIIRF